jgi:hypothetical protein
MRTANQTQPVQEWVVMAWNWLQTIAAEMTIVVENSYMTDGGSQGEMRQFSADRSKRQEDWTYRCRIRRFWPRWYCRPR